MESVPDPKKNMNMKLHYLTLIPRFFDDFGTNFGFAWFFSTFQKSKLPRGHFEIRILPSFRTSRFFRVSPIFAWLQKKSKNNNKLHTSNQRRESSLCASWASNQLISHSKNIWSEHDKSSKITNNHSLQGLSVSKVGHLFFRKLFESWLIGLSEKPFRRRRRKWHYFSIFHFISMK